MPNKTVGGLYLVPLEAIESDNGQSFEYKIRVYENDSIFDPRGFVTVAMNDDHEMSVNGFGKLCLSGNECSLNNE